MVENNITEPTLKGGLMTLLLKLEKSHLSNFRVEGMALSEPPSKGLYIVRCVNKDGAVTTLKKLN